MSFRKELLVAIPLAIAACNADKPQATEVPKTSDGIETAATFPWLVTLPADACIPSDLIFAVDSQHLYEFTVDVNGETIKQDYIITSNDQTVEFRKPNSQEVEKIETGANFGMLNTLDGEPHVIAKVLSANSDLITFQGCEQ